MNMHRDKLRLPHLSMNDEAELADKDIRSAGSTVREQPPSRQTPPAGLFTISKSAPKNKAVVCFVSAA